MAKIKVKLNAKWGEYAAGDVVTFDERKGRDVIAAGLGTPVKDDKPKARKKPAPKVAPKVETATAKPEAETADAPPSVIGPTAPAAGKEGE